jgi:hypothetical protein
MKNDTEINDLKNLNNIVLKLDKTHHLKIFNIILKNNIKYSENRNGIFINLNKVSLDTILEIKNYINYINVQEKNISNFENIKNEFKKDFFTNIKKEDKDNKNNNLVVNEKKNVKSFE